MTEMVEQEVVVNQSGLKPLGRAILVTTYEPERKGSMIQLPDEVRGRLDMVEQRCVVVEVGPACWPDEPARAVPGDKVLVSKMAGYQTKGTLDGRPYRLVNDRDVFCKITEEA